MVHQVKRTLIDTLGCAMGAFHAEPSRIARHLAESVTSRMSARVLGTRHASSPDIAGFANGVMVRYLDCNDSYFSPGGGHPSDMIPAVLAVAESHGADGRAVITAIAAAYEAFCRLADRIPLKGWDQGMFAAIGAACGAGKILGLDQAAIGNAISIAITSGVPLGVTRIGELSMWKGCATAGAIRTGVFAAELAAEGMTGPGHPFEGRDGLWQHLATEAPKWERFGGGGEPFSITGTSFKAYPSVIHTQGPIGLVLELRQQVGIAHIESVRVATYAEAVRRTAAEAEKWDPATRETADHSIPYLVAAALADGGVTPATFARSRIQDSCSEAASALTIRSPSRHAACGSGTAISRISAPRSRYTCRLLHARRGDDHGRAPGRGGDEPPEGAPSEPADGWRGRAQVPRPGLRGAGSQRVRSGAGGGVESGEGGDAGRTVREPRARDDCVRRRRSEQFVTEPSYSLLVARVGFEPTIGRTRFKRFER